MENEQEYGIMNISEFYRWNIPILTYGYDNSFLEIFKEQGKNEFESAVSALNNIPYDANIYQYPLNAMRGNYTASTENMYSLRTVFLNALIRTLGVADAESGMWLIRTQWVSANGVIAYATKRNYDPITLAPSSYINGSLFTYKYFTNKPSHYGITIFCPDPLSSTGTEIDVPSAGSFKTGLTRDEIGGIMFVTSPNIFCRGYVQLPASSNNIAQTTAIPGIGLIRFIPHPVTTNNIYQEYEYEYSFAHVNGNNNRSNIVRTIQQPDIVVKADNTKKGFQIKYGEFANMSELNGNKGGVGPGYFQPPVSIIVDTSLKWGVFDGSAAKPILINR
jgi:hypothetical protein